MLCLSLTQGDYVTIGGNVVLQLGRMSGDHCKVMIDAPREIPVVRGAVLEREGSGRPQCVQEAPAWRKPQIPWNRSRAQTLTAMRRLLSEMDGTDENVQTLRRQLRHMFPEGTEGA